ncbi:hypothetical protein [Sphaerochaeta globosa]|uniref:Uncharacterized protein n=1 Tax=Sphaerochaeta globosa (strain ATCC BAA-1886 / DSM 22777 / Buddy) TaxID=158189 RepID=F0RYF1_SPHGB|nr:hypothetical protein [Sphaerochaeta globosa]ADY12722.1 hypothetical protein SpiBuddy_0895 [Sphaerochaeta globosa str. Buddy]
MGNLQADIQQKQKEIEQHFSDVFSLYADLGRSVALVQQISSLRYAVNEYAKFCSELERYESAKHSYEQLLGYISQIEDRSRKIKEIEKDIRLLEKPFASVYAQLGAIAYEAYISQTLREHVRQACFPFFEDHAKKTRKLENRKQVHTGFVGRQIINVQLDLQRKVLPGLLVKAGQHLVAIECERDLPVIHRQSLLDELQHLKERQQELGQELELHHSAMAKLQSQEVQSPKARLEERASEMKSAQKAAEKAASVYGKALYETLPEDVHADQIGQKAILLMDQITLHRKRTKSLQREIKQLENLIQVQELQAQIELENQKIELLRSQIDTCNRQISQIAASIDGKHKRIATLLPPAQLTDG